MKCLVLLALAMFGCVLAQDARYNDGRYYPEYYETKWDDGRWRGDNRGKWNDGKYRPDAGGKYTGGKYGAGGAGGSGSGAGGAFGAGGAGGAGGNRFGSGSSSVSGSSGNFEASAGASFDSGAGAGGNDGGAFGAGAGFGTGSRFGGGSNSGSGSGNRGGAGSRFGSGGAGGDGAFEKIKEQTKEMNSDGYYYKYLNENNIEVAESGKIEDRDTDNEALRAKGYYEYVGDDGQKYRVDYTADENGFQAQGAHLPTPPPVPEEIARALSYIESQQRK